MIPPTDPESTSSSPSTTTTTSPPPLSPAPLPSSDEYEPWSEENLQQVMALWKLSDNDEVLLRKLQHRVSDVDHSWNDPHVLLRYMFGPHGYQKAEQLFRNMIDWRLANNVDTILQDYQPHPVLLQYASPLVFLKDYDHDGDPIYIERGGAIDGQGLLQRFPRSVLTQHAIWLRELQSGGPWVEEYERRQGRCIKDVTVVYDLQGLNSRHYNPNVLQWFQSHMKMTEDYYPGPIKRIIIIRAPMIFRAIWSMVKHFFPACAREKMIFAGSSNHLEILAKYMDIAILPPCINPGGKGQVATGMPDGLEAGKIPNSVGYLGEGYQAPPSSLFTVTTSTPTTQSPQSPQEPSMLPTPSSLVPRKDSKASSTETGSTVQELSYLDDLDSDDDEAATIINDAAPPTKLKSKLRQRLDKLCRRAVRRFVPTGQWEEISFSKSSETRRSAKIKDGDHILWHEQTGVEITHTDLFTEGSHYDYDDDGDEQDQVHILWHERTGVEITNSDLLAEQSLALV